MREMTLVQDLWMACHGAAMEVCVVEVWRFGKRAANDCKSVGREYLVE